MLLAPLMRLVDFDIDGTSERPASRLYIFDTFLYPTRMSWVMKLLRKLLERESTYSEGPRMAS